MLNKFCSTVGLIARNPDLVSCEQQIHVHKQAADPRSLTGTLAIRSLESIMITKLNTRKIWTTTRENLASARVCEQQRRIFAFWKLATNEIQIF